MVKTSTLSVLAILVSLVYAPICAAKNTTRDVAAAGTGAGVTTSAIVAAVIPVIGWGWTVVAGAGELGGAIIYGVSSDPPDLVNYAVRANNPLLIPSLTPAGDSPPEVNSVVLAYADSMSAFMQSMKNVFDSNDRLAGAMLVGTATDVANQTQWRKEFICHALHRYKHSQMLLAQFVDLFAGYPSAYNSTPSFNDVRDMRDQEAAGNFPAMEQQFIDDWQLNSTQVSFISSRFANLTDSGITAYGLVSAGAGLRFLADHTPDLGINSPCAPGTDVGVSGQQSILSLRTSPLGHGDVQLDFNLPRSGLARLAAFDVSGRMVHLILDAELRSGAHSVRWNWEEGPGRRVPSGLYYIQLKTDNETVSSRALFIK